MKRSEDVLTEIVLDQIYFRGGGKYTIFTREEMERLAEALRTDDGQKVIRTIEYMDDSIGEVKACECLNREEAKMVVSLAQRLRVNGLDGEISWRRLAEFTTLREFHAALHRRIVAALENDPKKIRRAGPKRTRA